MTKSEFYKISFLVCFWVTAAMLFVFLEGTIIVHEAEIKKATAITYNFDSAFFIAFTVSLVGSILIGSIEVLFCSKLFKNISFGINLVFRTLFYLVSIFFFTTVAVIYGYILANNLSLYDPPVFAYLQKYLMGQKMWLELLYWGIAVYFGLFILQVNDKFGKGVLVNLLTGKYHKPKEENRIFLFLDLVSSTAIAEQLGTFKYSSFVKDFFSDIDSIITKRKGSVFQYVGDEVVIIWKPENGTQNNNCVNIYFEAEEMIRSKEDIYREKYGVIPSFKAGMHYGKVIITEVGGTKQEIAYHGDTINTASRIRSLCTDYGEQVIISADLLSNLFDLDNEFEIKFLGVTALKGKSNELGLFSLSKKKPAG